MKKTIDFFFITGLSLFSFFIGIKVFSDNEIYLRVAFIIVGVFLFIIAILVLLNKRRTNYFIMRPKIVNEENHEKLPLWAKLLSTTSILIIVSIYFIVPIFNSLLVIFEPLPTIVRFIQSAYKIVGVVILFVLYSLRQCLLDTNDLNKKLYHLKTLQVITFLSMVLFFSIILGLLVGAL